RTALRLLGRARRARLRGAGVRAVEARALERHAHVADHALHLTAAVGAGLDRVVVETLDLFEPVTAVSALVHVRGHVYLPGVCSPHESSQRPRNDQARGAW